MAAVFKFLGMAETATYIAAAGFPFPLLLAWLAAIFEIALVICFLSGAFFSEAALLTAVYVLFLGFAFHGPSHWEGTGPGRVRLLHQSFHLHCRTAFRSVKGPGRMLALRHEHHSQMVAGPTTISSARSRESRLVEPA